VFYFVARLPQSQEYVGEMKLIKKVIRPVTGSGVQIANRGQASIHLSRARAYGSCYLCVGKHEWNPSIIIAGGIAGALWWSQIYGFHLDQGSRIVRGPAVDQARSCPILEEQK